MVYFGGCQDPVTVGWIIYSFQWREPYLVTFIIHCELVSRQGPRYIYLPTFGLNLWKITMWVFPKIGVPQNGWFIRENLIRTDDLGGKTPILGNTHIKFQCLEIFEILGDQKFQFQGWRGFGIPFPSIRHKMRVSSLPLGRIDPSIYGTAEGHRSKIRPLGTKNHGLLGGTLLGCPVGS